jgi:hypothetical protein
MKTLVFSILLLFLAVQLMGQETFERIYERTGDDLGRAVVQADSGYIVAGNAQGPGPNLSDAYLMRLGPGGDTLWTRLLGYKGTDLFTSLMTLGTDTFAAFGTYSHMNPARSDFYLAEFTGSGDTLWTRNTFTATNAYGYSAAWTGNGFILCGYGEDSKGVPYMLLVRTDAAGDTLWTRRYGGALSGVGTSVIRTYDNHYVACGYVDHEDPFNRNIYLVKTTPSGDTLWTREIGLGGYEVAWSVAETNDNGYILTGYHWAGSAGNASLYVVKTDVMGLFMWDKSYGNAGLDVGYSCIQTNDGGYAVTGFTTLASGLQSLYLVRTGPSGDTLWTRRFGAPPLSAGYSVRETDGGGFVIAGATNSIGGNLYDVYVVRTDDNGTVTGSPDAASPVAPLTVWPNPASGFVTIKFASPPAFMDLTDLQGRVLLTRSREALSGATITLDLRGFPPGLFILRAGTLQTVFTEKILLK